MSDRKRMKMEDPGNSDNETVEFTVTTKVYANKQKLASLSEVFQKVFKYEKGAIEITDCTEKVFALFIAILEGRDTFEGLKKAGILGLSELFELLNMVEKYLIENVELKDSIEAAILDFPIDKDNLIRMMKVVKEWKTVPFFEPLCDKLRRTCAKFFLSQYKTANDIITILADFKEYDIKAGIYIYRNNHLFSSPLSDNFFLLCVDGCGVSWAPVAPTEIFK